MLWLQLTLLTSGKIQWRRCCISHLEGMQKLLQKNPFFLLENTSLWKEKVLIRSRMFVSFNFVKGFSVIQKNYAFSNTSLDKLSHYWGVGEDNKGKKQVQIVSHSSVNSFSLLVYWPFLKLKLVFIFRKGNLKNLEKYPR